MFEKKDISFEIPSPDCFVSAAENLGSYSTKLDLASKPFKNNLAELNCKFLLEAPENLKNKIHAEVCISIVFKLTDESSSLLFDTPRIIKIKMPAKKNEDKKNFELLKKIFFFNFIFFELVIPGKLST